MGFLSRWFPKTQTLEVVPENPVVYKGKKASLTTGAWVRTPDDRIGILVGDGVVVLTNAAGTNVMEPVGDSMVPKTVEYPISILRRARIADIPITRYESREQLIALGYGDH